MSLPVFLHPLTSVVNPSDSLESPLYVLYDVEFHVILHSHLEYDQHTHPNPYRQKIHRCGILQRVQQACYDASSPGHVLDGVVVNPDVQILPKPHGANLDREPMLQPRDQVEVEDSSVAEVVTSVRHVLLGAKLSVAEGPRVQRLPAHFETVVEWQA